MTHEIDSFNLAGLPFSRRITNVPMTIPSFVNTSGTAGS